METPIRRPSVALQQTYNCRRDRYAATAAAITSPRRCSAERRMATTLSFSGRRNRSRSAASSGAMQTPSRGVGAGQHRIKALLVLQHDLDGGGLFDRVIFGHDIFVAADDETRSECLGRAQGRSAPTGRAGW